MFSRCGTDAKITLHLWGFEFILYEYFIVCMHAKLEAKRRASRISEDFQAKLESHNIGPTDVSTGIPRLIFLSDKTEIVEINMIVGSSCAYIKNNRFQSLFFIVSYLS